MKEVKYRGREGGEKQDGDKDVEEQKDKRRRLKEEVEEEGGIRNTSRERREL